MVQRTTWKVHGESTSVLQHNTRDLHFYEAKKKFNGVSCHRRTSQNSKSGTLTACHAGWLVDSLFTMQIAENGKWRGVARTRTTVSPGNCALLRANFCDLVNSTVYLWSLYCIRPGAGGTLMQTFFSKVLTHLSAFAPSLTPSPPASSRPAANYAEQMRDRCYQWVDR